jgi:RNA polymerase sigma-70 factor, ECF subfamily
VSTLSGMQETDPRDSVLVAKARLGDAAAFESLVRKYARPAFAAALAVLANQADAEDVCQDAWVRALERLEECRNPERFVFWLLQIVRNRARNYVHYRRVRETAQLEDAFGPDGPPGQDDSSREWRRHQQRARLERALAELTAAQREVLLLHDLAGWKHRAIAESIGISEVMSRQHLFQARARMRRLLGTAADGGGP